MGVSFSHFSDLKSTCQKLELERSFSLATPTNLENASSKLIQILPGQGGTVSLSTITERAIKTPAKRQTDSPRYSTAAPGSSLSPATTSYIINQTYDDDSMTIYSSSAAIYSQPASPAQPYSFTPTPLKQHQMSQDPPPLHHLAQLPVHRNKNHHPAQARLITRHCYHHQNSPNFKTQN
ncbi:hypothetical protein QBC36DRAFT_311097 [Triangularia setosa]|uniref:Uncharacterized protein n=1 Tax=Triangularia setosa TaxID=2587417 RepID=A0AAN6W9C7_9PEZI|nr:hypothetical protein QBC36DRAFT_311097 [Podospora setosa]